MIIIFWLAIPILFLTGYFVMPQGKKQPEIGSESLATQGEQAVPVVPAVEPVSISISPTTLIQGEPARIIINGLASPSSIKSLDFAGEQLSVFADEDKIAALIGIDFHKRSDTYPIVLTLEDGQKIESSIIVGQRAVETSEFDIPEQLGGNTPKAEHQLSSSLAEDMAVMNAVIAATGPEKLWNGPFRFPLDGSVTVTDVYGYKRQTGSVSLSHQGTDFRAAEGTPVYAANSGLVAFAGTLRNYGHTVIIDHGLGLMTFYMHLSETKVEKGMNVARGDLIAESGNTGYSLGPHLHLSVRINGFTIDPIKFLKLMGTK